MGVAVNVTVSPMHGLMRVALIDTEGIVAFVTIIEMVLLVAVGVPKHPLVAVTIQLTVLPFAQTLSVYVALLVPTFTPFFFHW